MSENQAMPLRRLSAVHRGSTLGANFQRAFCRSELLQESPDDVRVVARLAAAAGQLGNARRGFYLAHANPSAPLPASMVFFTVQLATSITAILWLESQDA